MSKAEHLKVINEAKARGQGSAFLFLASQEETLG
jgi:hypothetical protein